MRPARLERATYGSGGRRSIQLNYGRGFFDYIGTQPEHNRTAARKIDR